MKEEAFRSWLSNNRCSANGGTLGARTISSRLSNCRTVERFEGDLDHHFDRDHLRGLVDTLTYSKSDERQSRPARHQIPIDGNVYNGTATLRSAVSLYRQFRENWIEGTPILPAVATRKHAPAISRSAKSPGARIWPTWDQPGSDEVLELAHIAAPFVRFLSPDVVRAVVEDNEQHRVEWIKSLQARQIDPMAYLWEQSPCAFPGVRRYAGSREIAAYRGHAKLDVDQSVNALALDDND